jgi:hypothetical protein
MTYGWPSYLGLCQERPQATAELPFITKLALPDDPNAEAKLLHLGFLASVARFVTSDLPSPPLLIGSWKTREWARFMSMPETPVNENAPSPRLVRNVRTPREVRGANAETSTKAM